MTGGSSRRALPTTAGLDLVRLAGGVLAEMARHPRTFSVAGAFRRWARNAAARRSSENLILNLGVKRVLLVGGAGLSEEILHPQPHPGGLVAGDLKRSAMSFLAPRAVTISDGEDWRRRRELNERVLEPGRTHSLRPLIVSSVLTELSPDIRDVAGLRAAMGRTMLSIVFGGKAPPALADDVRALFGVVQSPLKRKLLGPWARRRRRRFYDSLQRVWRETRVDDAPSLLQAAHRSAGTLDEAELLEQIPHWMFTFTGSGSDLLARALTLVLSDPSVRARVRAEIEAAGDPGAVERLPYVRACLLEAAQLFPPVTRTFHRAPAGITLDGVAIPAGVEIMHLFPLISELGGAARHFRPERWLEPGGPEAGFDPFLRGARRCPGRDLILLVCTTALARLAGPDGVTLESPPIDTNALGDDFPLGRLRFHPARSRP